MKTESEACVQKIFIRLSLEFEPAILGKIMTTSDRYLKMSLLFFAIIMPDRKYLPTITYSTNALCFYSSPKNISLLLLSVLGSIIFQYTSKQH